MGTSLRTRFLSAAFLLSALHTALAEIDAGPFQDYSSVLVIDTFPTAWQNDLGAWHGAEEGMQAEFGPGYVSLYASQSEQIFHTKVAPTCRDMSEFAGMYLHIAFEGTTQFTISLQQHNEACDQGVSPAPETWDSIEAARYARGNDIYIPIWHFNIDLSRTVAVSFHGFYTQESLRLYKVEITASLPWDFYVPDKLPSGTVVLKCRRPNSFAFGIDDGKPKYAREVMDILEEEGVKVTFFAVGNGLVDPFAPFQQVYREMSERGHQIALHSYSHPRLESLQTKEEIDYQFTENMRVLRETLGLESKYFRPPYGVVGARTRQSFAALVDDPYIVNWSVDIEDWLWAESKTPRKQVDAFRRDLNKGGDLAVLHFLNRSTVRYLRDVINLVRQAGKDIMRVDQCMYDPDAPPIEWAWMRPGNGTQRIGHQNSTIGRNMTAVKEKRWHRDL
ncbi:hypothetical protein AJ80_06397 [Polytolypa hystricis UAMH7299]|uniref:NodB homology domain-containing protein n=1 Tax=Polytolypa hystricis (strain UAMH7299) TaxID=1447883 RepID=A0A2B7XVR0_POLH7|nr:hypothetical protein AJ80_06397 [Polytolypa hystricis UAMH7299]